MKNDNSNLTTIEIVDDGFPTLGISSDNTTLTEAEEIVVKIEHESVVPTSQLIVTYNINQNGLNFIEANHSNTGNNSTQPICKPNILT